MDAQSELSVGRRALRDQRGQSMIVVVMAMVVIVGMAAVAIDLATWYQRHHSAQVAADGSALAAANCLADSSSTNVATNTCTSTTDSNANTVATTLAANNGYTLTSASNVQVGFDSVTVTVPTRAPALFAGIAKITNANITARAVASFWGTGEKFNCSGNLCLSFFSANTTCPSSKSNQTVGLDLVTNDSGGGSSLISNAWSNGYFYDGANSNVAVFDVTMPGSGGSPTCSTANGPNAKGASVTYTSAAVPYPAVWPIPVVSKCTRWATYFSTASGTPAQNQITTPGIYCVTSDGTSGGSLSTTASPSCQSSAGSMTSGYIYLDESSAALTAGGPYQFVSPCTILANTTNPTISNIPGQPLVYGTSNITTPATSSSLPTCSAASNNGTAGSDTWILGNNSNLNAPVYDQCGTVNINQNNAFLGFIESWNLIVQKNNSATGTGPTSGGGSNGVSTLSAGDSLSN